MIELFVGGLFVLLALGLAAVVLIALPLMLIGAALRLVFGLILLPFKLLGALLGLAFGVAGLLAKGLVLLLTVLIGGLLLVGGVALLALAPLLLIGLAVWLLARASMPAVA